MKNRIALLSTLALGFAVLPAGAVTPIGNAATVTSPEAKVEVINAVVSSIDVKRGVMSASGRTFRFDPAAIAFSDERKQPAASLEGLKPGSKVTLRSFQQNGTNRLMQIVAHD